MWYYYYHLYIQCHLFTWRHVVTWRNLFVCDIIYTDVLFIHIL